jgi:hypothetical protein
MTTVKNDPVLDWWHDYYERPASLDPVETAGNERSELSLYVPPPGCEYVKQDRGYFNFLICNNFRHSGWQKFRRRVAVAMNHVYGPQAALHRFCQCGASMWILRNRDNPTEYKAVPDNCKSRWCIPCYGARTARLRARLAAGLPNGPVRMVTLTLKASESSLQECLNRLYDSFRKLRGRPFWKSRTLGGVAFLEFKRGGTSGLWHPHLHCLVQGRFLPQSELAQEWLCVTGDSHVVDVRLVRAREQVMHYVTKYCSKSNGISEESTDDDLIEIIRTLKGRRTVVPFGTWRTLRLLHTGGDEDWELVGHLQELEVKASQEDTYAESVLTAYRECCYERTGIFHLFTDADG